MIKKYALIETDGTVSNTVLWDGETEWEPPAGVTVVEVPDGQSCGPSWTYDGTNWTAPPVEDEEGEV